jgi:colanic acid/amylovoran biosynthesis glycosyltransferase
LRIFVATDRFPELSETFITAEVEALAGLGHDLRVEATWEAGKPGPAPDVQATFMAHDGRRRKLLDLAWLVARHPLRSLADLLARRRWAREEAVRPLRALAPAARRLLRGGELHVHVHFAAEAALDWMRIAAIARLPYTVTAHAYEIFMSPANLREKLERAAFATTGCDYNVRHLRILAPRADVREIVMGVDRERFRRSTPYGQGATPHVLAVGRLVEKKGFVYLAGAADELPDVRFSIVGAGPLESELRDRRIELLGARQPGEVRSLLEGADLLAMPCVVAEGGDRDSMPVVVKEALAMEVPVVATDEVGLPELVRAEWGRLVPPRDSRALAAAIRELLALPVEERAAMGRAGRTHVLEAASVRRETEKLAGLIATATASGGGGSRRAIPPARSPSRRR